MQYASLGESYAIGDFLQGSAVIAERPKQFDGRVEDRRFPVDFFVGHVDSPLALHNDDLRTHSAW